MNCVPDFVDCWCFLGMPAFSGAILYLTIQIDNELGACNQRRLWRVWFVMCCVIGLGVRGHMWNGQTECISSLLILAVYLVVCSVMDSMLSRVNDFMQYVGVVGGGFWLWNHFPKREIGFSLLFFVLIQYVVFRRMYGEADMAAFVICALYFAGENRGIESFLVHMAMCYFFLAVVQCWKRNINKRGNLKKPVPLYPYISTSFLLVFY